MIVRHKFYSLITLTDPSLCNLITLDASESFDPDGGNLSYLWEQVEGETVDLVDTATKNPKFTPANPGVYRFSLKVKNDKGKESVTDDVSVLVSANGNSENLRELFLVMDELFGKLPKREVKKFVAAFFRVAFIFFNFWNSSSFVSCFSCASFSLVC